MQTHIVLIFPTIIVNLEMKELRNIVRTLTGKPIPKRSNPINPRKYFQLYVVSRKTSRRNRGIKTIFLANPRGGQGKIADFPKMLKFSKCTILET